jgi:phenylacetate-coenzyme A ligase PaaK-like adenylate-forming protein
MDLHAKQLREEFWKNDALNGSPIGKPYKEIEFLSESSKEDGQEIRDRKLREMLLYAKTNCPFYKSFFLGGG